MAGVWDQTDIEVMVSDDRISLWYRSRHMIDVGVNEAGQFCLAVTNDVFDAFAVGEHLPVRLKKLLTFVITKEQEQPMGLAKPRYNRHAARDEVVEPTRRTDQTFTTSAETIAESERNAVLNAILDSEIDHPNLDKKARAAETARIAETLGVRLFAVAAVRAHITMGTYEGKNLEQLLARRRIERKALAVTEADLMRRAPRTRTARAK